MKERLPERLLQRHIPTLLSNWRANGNISPLSRKELFSVSSALLQLQRGLTGDRSLAGKGYMDSVPLLGSYLLYYWPVSYMQISTASLSALKKLSSIASKRKVRILDVGSGPGPASAALCDVLSTVGAGEISIVLADSSKKALSLAQRIFKSDFPSAGVTTSVCDFEKGMAESVDADIIIMSHVLNELWNGKEDAVSRRSDFLMRLCRNLSDGGILFLCEPAMLKTSRSLIEVRNRLAENGFTVVSPCTRTSACPALLQESLTCHAEVPWKPCEPVASIARGAGLDRISVKMSYFIMERKTSADEAERKNLRVVSDPMLNKSGRIRYVLCDGKERFTLSAKKDDVHAEETGFFSLGRYDALTLHNPEIRGGDGNRSFGIAPGTSLEVEPFSC